MIRAKEARQEAREALSGKWGKAIVISLIYTLITAGISFLSVFTFGLLSIALIVIAPALSYGLAYSYYHLKNGEEVGYGDFLSVGFKNFGYSWKLTWNIIKKCWVYILILVLAIIIIIVASVGLTIGTVGSILSSANDKTYYSTSYNYKDNFDYYDDNIDYESYYDSLQDLYDDYYDEYSKYNDSYYDNYNDYDNMFAQNAESALIGAIAGASVAVVGIVLLIFIAYLVFIIFFIRKVMLYALTFYVAVKNEGIEAKEAVLESERLMDGNRGRLFCLILSFIGWSILIGFVSALLALIPFLGTIASYAGTIILTPYMTFAILAFYRDLDEEKNAYVNSKVNSNENIQTNANVVNSASQINNTSETKSNDENITVNTQNVQNNSGKKYCKRCGAENTSDATYCTNCGAKLD